MSLALLLLAAVVAARFVSIGGGLYETALIDPVWPENPALIRPGLGGISRKRFWIPVHAAFELALVAAVVAWWPEQVVRGWLLAAAASHVAMRGWSAAYFIPRALRFERGDPSLTRDDARRWARQSWMRLPLDVATALFCAIAFVQALAAAGLAGR